MMAASTNMQESVNLSEFGLGRLRAFICVCVRVRAGMHACVRVRVRVCASTTARIPGHADHAARS